MTLQVNDIIDGKYRIVRLLGEGGMGAVYEGENTRIHRRVAIKVLHSGVAQSKDAVERFEREAQAAGRIGSEHIVEVLDLGNLPNGERYMVMEFLEGESLSDRIDSRGKLEVDVAAQVAFELLEGLKAAHAAGIIHRDLKPDNVFLLALRSGRRDFVKIVDFGISKFSTLGGDFSMTRTGAVMGTPYYMAPEQAKGERTVDHRADLYSVGVILYQAAAGEVPFDAETFNELLFKIVLENPIPLADRVPDMDPRFSSIVEKAMAKTASERYQSAEEFQAAIRGFLDEVPVSKGKTAHSGTPLRAFAPTKFGQKEGKAHAQTHGAWANTQGGGEPVEAAAARRTPKWAWAAAAVVMLGAGATAFLGLQGQPAGAPPAAAASQPAATASKAVKPTVEAAPSNVVTAQAPTPGESDAPRADEPTAAVSPTPSAPTASPPKAVPTTETRRVSQVRSVPKSPPAPSRPARPAASTSTSAGRTIRTTL